MSRVRVRRASALLAAGLLVVACTESSDETVERTTTSAPSAGSTTEAVNEWALEYTGGSAGAADPSLEPVVVGYVNQEGGVPAFPEATAATEAAVEYINAELGGIGGHPLELKHCSVQAEEDDAAPRW
jgi:branched-chain amino acid transport system substrate-binding protein